MSQMNDWHHVALGDIFCTAQEAQAGVLAVGQLLDYWQSVGSPPQFASAVGAIVGRGKAAADQNTALTSAVGNCALKDVGLQAQDLTAQIAASVGKPAPAGTIVKGPTGQLGDIATYVGYAAVLVGGYFAYRWYKGVTS